ncbi:hypothetical protein ABZ816_38555 [Actinosynnema sp. NPDC047251]|uniref:SCO6045-like C-terminal domain-containing protein n=1 Tax=Saccharothrix espanaensis (strain ATCC 51144 / DSM 44229 / JCM 9112 / NBRC 15066 / NRRL 15764) TaxID=1179773 RepID=K0JYB2_SACES|nr:hypothetical protein [Saccharothrix espanaensis]CCH29188.1 hypothetical protein BN6_18680 [Saccharothrix espanaensis DSM 44229]
MTQPQRDRLAAAQAELLHSLMADGPPPAGFDPERLRVEARSLLNKRRGIVAMLRPEVAAELGERFRPLFDEYARAHPRRTGSRFREDAAAFAAWATERGELAPPPKRRWWRRAT